MKGPVDVTLTKARPPRRRGWWWGFDDDDVYDGDVGVLRIGRDLAVVETTFANSDGVTGPWLREAASLARGRRRLRAPLVAGLVALRGHDPAAVDGCWSAPPAFSASDPGNPIRGVALCLGGSRVLVYRPEEFGRCRRAPAGARARLHFVEGNNMNQLCAFLDDKRITVACFGAGMKAAEKLAEEWGLHVARPAELTDLFARAYGKVAGAADAEKRPRTHPKHRTGKPPLFARTKARAGTWGPATQGTRAAKVARRGLTLERMARVALGGEMRLERPPAKVAGADWGGHDLGEEEWAYATRDALLCFEVAARCLQKLGFPIGA
ncbi:hypothetical protein ACP70R_037345 [Stipagrostis hirtigluma subsp. patula]